MKKLSVATFGVLGVLLLAATSNAANPPGPVVSPSQPHQTPIASSGLQLNPLKLVSLTRAPNAQNGSFMIDVGVENVSATPKAMFVEAHAVGAGGGYDQKDENVPAHTTKHFLFGDASGGPTLCSISASKEYTIKIKDSLNGTAVAHTAILKVSACGSVVATAANPWNLKSPDQVDYMTKSTLYAEAASIVEQPTCDKPLKLKVNVINHTQTAQNGLHVVSKASPNATPASSAAINLAPGGYTSTTISYQPGTFAAVPIHLEGGNHLVDAGMSVTVNATCNWSTEIDPHPSAQPAQAVPR